MSFSTRFVIAVLWMLSLITASQWSASAQLNPPGSEVRFVQTGTDKTGNPMGMLLAKVNGEWKAASLNPGGFGIHPIDGK